MKRILILLALGLFWCSTASAFQGGGGESTTKKAIPTKTSGTKPDKNAPPRSNSRTIEGTVLGYNGTKWVQGINIESNGERYWVVYFVHGQKQAPKIIGGDDYSTGTRVRVAFVKDKNNGFLKATSIVRLDSRMVDTAPTPTDENGFQVFFTEFSSAVRRRDAATLKLMMSSTFDFTMYGDDKLSVAFDYLASGNGQGWNSLEKSITTGTKSYQDSGPQTVTRVTNDNALLFGRGSDRKWRWLRFLLL